jgi:hypothetical protein
VVETNARVVSEEIVVIGILTREGVIGARDSATFGAGEPSKSHCRCIRQIAGYYGPLGQ